MRILFSIWLLLMMIQVQGQFLLKGRVQQSNGEPVPAASVFLSNTGIGTVANNEGEFILVNIPNGRYELVVTALGYQTFVKQVSETPGEQIINVVLTPKADELKEVVVEAYETGDWNKWGKFFTEQFIGTVPFAGQCVLKNKSALQFRYYARQKRLVVFSKFPLIIENSALGYRIKYQLEDFIYYFSQGMLYYAGFPLFEELKEKGEPRQKWLRNRDKAYYGSKMHFMRSLYRNQLSENNFEMRQMKAVPNLEKQRVRTAMVAAPDGKGPVKANAIGGSNRIISLGSDSSMYYASIMRQADTLYQLTAAIMPADSIAYAISNTIAGMDFTDKVQVKYTGAKEDDAYLRHIGANRKPGSQESIMWLPNGRPVEILQNGAFFEGADLLVSGYWAWHTKIAHLLPLEYKPKSNRPAVESNSK